MKYLFLIFTAFFVLACSENKSTHVRAGTNINKSSSTTISKSTDNSFLLRLNLNKDDRYITTMETTQDITQEVVGKKQNMKQKMTFIYDNLIENIGTDSVITQKTMFKDIIYEIEGPTGKISYDSRKDKKIDESNIMGLIFSSYIGKSFTLKFKPNGEILSISGFGQIIQSIINKLAKKAPPGTNPATIETTVKQFMNEDKFKNTFQESNNWIPKKPIKVGDTWNFITTKDVNFKIKLDNTYKLLNIDNDTLKIQVNTKINTIPESTQMGLVKVKYDLKGTQEGFLYVNMKNGVVNHGALTQKFSGNAKTEKNEMMKESMTFPISLNSVINISNKFVNK